VRCLRNSRCRNRFRRVRVPGADLEETPGMDGLAQDVRHAFRLLRKSPGFSLVVIATLALGIGANTAIFSLLDQLLVRLLPVRDPKRLVLLSGPGVTTGMVESSSDTVQPFSQPMFLDFRDRSDRVFSGVLARFPLQLDVNDRGGTETANGSLVSGGYFEVLGVAPAIGRVLAPADDVSPGAHPVVVLSHGYWLRRFAGDPGVLGRSINLNGHPLSVVGVAAPGFHGTQIGRSDDLFVPLMMKAQMTPTWNGLGDRRVMWLEVLARLKPGVTSEQAEAAMAVVYRQSLEAEARELAGRSQKFLKEFVSKKLVILPGGQGLPELQRRLKTPLAVLMAMVGLVVLIACANVANLLLARASSRQKEIAVRLAIGAGRAQLVRQLLVESLTLSLLGALAGLPLAAATTGVLLRALPFEGVALTLSSSLDGRVVLFALGLSLVTALLVGVVPALQSTRPNLVCALKEEGAVAGAVGPLRFRKGLVIAQVALSALLLVGAGLFSRSLANLRALDPGFRSDGLLSFSLTPRRSGYSAGETRAVLARARERLLALPGVRAVSMAVNPLMTESIWQSTVKVEGYTPGEEENMNPRVNGVGPAFFTALGMPLVAGREIDERDGPGAPKVAVVNETFARRYFKDRSPIGRRIGWGHESGELPIEIVGVVRDARVDRVREEPQRFVFVSYAQDEDTTGLVFYVRTGGDPAALAATVRTAMREQNAALPVTDLKTMAVVVDESLFTDRIVAGLSAAFGLLATLLAAVGLYGVMSYAVSRRTREIGVRVALGADGRRILKLVLGEIAILSGIGMAIGLPGGWGLGRLVESRLFGLKAFDPPTLLLAAAVLAAATLLAGALPALRALRVEPATALRYE
jgi:predicted permease